MGPADIDALVDYVCDEWAGPATGAVPLQACAPPFADSTAIAMALIRPECDRLREFASVGPVQRAAVQSFADALLGSAPGVPTRHLTVTTDTEGNAVMVAWQDDEHRVLEVVWERAHVAPAVPAGWAFYSADFSLRARDCQRHGRVLLVRTGESFRAWFAQDEADQHRVPLYIAGFGDTVQDAIAEAAKEAEKAFAVVGCAPPQAEPANITMAEAVAAVDGTLHHAIDHWQDRALKAEAALASRAPAAPVAVDAGEPSNLHMVAAQVLRDMEAQGVLIEWQTLLDDAICAAGAGRAAERELCAKYLLRVAADCPDGGPVRATLEACAGVIMLGGLNGPR
jgi:hypothetical protein